MSIRCAIDLELTEEELLFILRHRAGQTTAPVSPPEETGQAKGNETPASSGPVPAVTGDYPMTEGIPPPAPRPEVIPEERIEAAASSHIAAALPPKPTRRAKANGAEAPINSTPLAPSPPPEPKPLDEPAMRSLLSKVGAVHPLKVKAITDLLEAHGGRRRLSECDPLTWPAIAEAARAVLVEFC